MKDKWSGLGLFYKVSMFLIILGLLTMIIGLILIATAKTGDIPVIGSQNGFNYLNNNNIGDVLKNSTPPNLSGFSDNAWMQLQWGVGLAVIATPILFGLVIISTILGFFAIGTKNS